MPSSCIGSNPACSAPISDSCAPFKIDAYLEQLQSELDEQRGAAAAAAAAASERDDVTDAAGAVEESSVLTREPWEP